jgi:all-trans-retinol 13,14-reductase
MEHQRSLFYLQGDPHRGAPLNTARSPARSKYSKPMDYISNPDAIVIGSGIGGLGIASTLAQKRGMRVLLLEAGPTPGGCTHVHELDGFEFPTGVDSIGDMDPRVGRGVFRPAIDFITGGALAWAKMPDLHETACFGDDVFPWYSSPEANIEWIERRFAGEGDVRGYYSLEEKIEWWGWSWGLTKLLPERMPVSVREAIYKRTGGAWREYMGRSVNDVFRRELGFSERLASVFSYMYGNHGRTPEHRSVRFSRGESVSLSLWRVLSRWRAVADRRVRAPHRRAGRRPVRVLVGGEAHRRRERERAVGVDLEDGTHIRSPLVISDASAYTTFVELLEPEVSVRYGYISRFDDIGPSPSHVFLLLGYDEEIDLPKEIIWHMPTYEGFSRWDLSGQDDQYKNHMRFKGMGGYLLSPSAREPLHSQRYPGTSTVVVLAEGIPAWVERARKDPAFRLEFSGQIEENLLAIAHRHMPVLRGKTPKLVRSGIPMGCNPARGRAARSASSRAVIAS